MMYTTPQNDCGLTQCEVDSLEAMVQTGHAKLAATRRGCSQRTINVQIEAAGKKLEAPNRILTLLAWDRMRRAG